jgi:cold shock CspA family protein
MASGPSVTGTVRGRIASFDDPEGYGTVVAADPAGEWFFHCTGIADGTRSIEVGAEVAFEVVPGRLGRFEATNLRPT